MSKELSLETRASSAYVQGRLTELFSNHRLCFQHFDKCDLLDDCLELLNEWKQAEAELKASKESK